MTDKKETKKEAEVPAVQEKQEVATPQDNATPMGFAGNIDPNDLQLPRIELLQALSPAVSNGEGTVGKMINTLTKEELGDKGESVVITPIRCEKNFIRWIPRDQGGGIEYRTNDPNDPRVIEDIKWVNNEKPKCTQYLNFLCMVEGEDLPMIASFAMTSYKAGRDLLTMAFMTGKSCFAYSYVLSAQKTTNNFGTFYKFAVKREGPTPKDKQEEAVKLCQMFGKHDINQESKSSEAPATGSNFKGDEF